MPLAWILLLLAGVFEWGWPVGLKLAMREDGFRWGPALFSGVCMVFSGWLLLLAQRTIPMGTAYAVWTGVGAVGAFLLGILFFDEPTKLLRFVFVAFILVGIVGLKLASE